MKPERRGQSKKKKNVLVKDALVFGSAAPSPLPYYGILYSPNYSSNLYTKCSSDSFSKDIALFSEEEPTICYWKLSFFTKTTKWGPEGDAFCLKLICRLRLTPDG